MPSLDPSPKDQTAAQTCGIYRIP